VNRDETLSPTHLCVSVNACKQATPEKPEVTFTRRTIMEFCTRRLWYGLSAWGKIMACLLPLVTHMQKLSY